MAEKAMSPAGKKAILEKCFYRDLADMLIINKTVVSLSSRLSNAQDLSVLGSKISWMVFEEKQEEIVKSMNVVMCLMVLEDKIFVT